jgi:hypothetical protein
MDKLERIMKDAEIGMTNTNMFSDVDICQGGTIIASGPYMPISSGNYNVISVETSDFQSFLITGKY